MSAGERLDEFETLKAQVAEARERVERDLQELASRLSTRNLKAEATDAIGSWVREGAGQLVSTGTLKSLAILRSMRRRPGRTSLIAFGAVLLVWSIRRARASGR